MVDKIKLKFYGLHTIAVVSIIVYNAKINFLGYQLFQGGFIGIDIFFVTSGYLITLTILNQLISKESFSLKYFYERRIVKIFPTLLLVILVSFPFAWKFLLPSSLLNFINSIITSLSFNSNLFFHYSGNQIAELGSLSKPFNHTWALSVLIQYYLFFPITLVLIFKNFRKFLLYFFIIGFIVSLGLADWTSRNYPSVSFYFLHTRIWEFLLGSILAYLVVRKKNENKNKSLNLILAIFGLILISYSILFFNNKMIHPSIFTLLPLFGVCLVIYFSDESNLIANLLSNKIFVLVGLSSYSLYIWHYPIFSFYNYAFAKGSIFIEILIIICLFIISFLNYFFIEKYFRNKNIAFSKKLNWLIFLISVIFLLSGFIISKKGFPNKGVIDGINLDYSHYVNEISKWKKNNKETETPDDTKYLITIVGDSQAQNFALLFQTNLDLFSNYKFLPLTISKFNEILNNKHKNTKEDFFVKQSKLVIFSFNYTEQDLLEVENTINLILKSTDKKIILTSNNPVFNIYGSRFSDLDFFLLKNNRKPNKNELINLEEQYYLFLKKNDTFHEINKKLEKLSKTYKLKLVNRYLYQCDDVKKRCQVLTNNHDKINYDSHHHTLLGAKYLGKKLHKLNLMGLN